MRILKIIKDEKGFTLVELLVSIGIFVFITALILVKNGSFDNSVTLTNLAYEMALAAREAQSSSLGVKAASATDFSSGFGVEFDTANDKIFTYYEDKKLSAPDNYYYDGGVQDKELKQYVIKRGNYISGVCAGLNESGCSDAEKINIAFRRPDPTAHICRYESGVSDNCENAYAKVTVMSPEGDTQEIIFQKTGQISVVGE